MLINIDPLLTPALLRELAAMGHGDFISICDRNFPAYSNAGGKPLIHLPGTGILATLRAILSVMPLDTYDGSPVQRMAHVDDPQALPAIQRQAIEEIFSRLDPAPEVTGLERHAYYERSRSAFAVVITGETLPYGNFLLRKGVV